MLRKTEFAIYFAVMIFIGFANYKTYNDDVSLYLEHKRESIQFQYNTITRDLREKSNIYFHEVVNKPEILSLVAELNYEDPNQTAIARNILIQKLDDSYRRMSLNEVRQLHFHTKDSKSFLRMHKKNKFGDYLGDVRYSIGSVNKTFKSYHGFEEGLIFSGFRNVYPLMLNNNFIGSVEISFTLKAVEFAFEQTFGGNYSFIFRNDIIKAKLFDFDEYYNQLNFNDKFCYEKAENIAYMDKLPADTINIINNNLSSMKSFSVSLSFENEEKVINFLPVKNIHGDQIGYLVNINKDNFIEVEQRNKLLYFLFFSFVTNALIYFVFLNMRRSEKNLINNIFHNHTDMIILLKKGQIQDFNRKFLDFIGVNSSRDIKNNNHVVSIFDFFIEEKDYLYKNNESYEQLLNKLKLSGQKVKMQNVKTNEIRVFELSQINFKDYRIDFIVFTDITMKMIFSDTSKNAVQYRDKLTGIFNRTKFETDVKSIIYKNNTLSLILFNIDDFGSINDRYGDMTGDRVLIELTILIDSQIRKSDVIYKYSGNDFIVITNENILGATKLAEKLRIIIEQHSFFKEISITASFGVTEYHKLEEEDDLLIRCEKNLQDAKSSGKNCVVTN